MVITYYIDYIVLINFVIDFFLLLLIHPNQKKNYLRIMLAAGIGSGATILLMLLYGSGQTIVSMILRFITAVLMVELGCPQNGIGELICNTALLYGAAGSLFGIYTLLQNKLQGKVSTEGLFVCSILIHMLGKILYQFRKQRNHRNTYFYPVILSNGQNSIKTNAFLDSGNHLLEPISGKPVVLIQEKLMKLLKPKEETLRMVPYSSLGKKDGVLKAYRIEKLIVIIDKEEKISESIYAATAEDSLWNGNEYKIILHPKMVQEKNEKKGLVER